jgi:hypothetical protein
VSGAGWLAELDRRLGRALARGAVPAAGTAVATAGLALGLWALEASACGSEAFHRRHVRGTRSRVLFRTEDGAVVAHLLLDGAELRAGGGSAGRPDDAEWDAVIVFRDARCLAGLVTPGADLEAALLRRELRLLGNPAHVYRLGYMLADLRARLRGRGGKPGGGA